MGELIGYARCSTVLPDLTAQRQALAAVRSGDTLVVPKLDRLARSVPDARHIGDSLVARGLLAWSARCATTWVARVSRCFIRRAWSRPRARRDSTLRFSPATGAACT